MSGAVIEIIQARGKNADGKEEEPVVVARAVYEHPFVVRLCHWLNTVSLFVMVGSGLQIFRAFPSFGAKIPQKDLLHWPRAFAIGGWLGGALQWHLTFMWIYIATGLFYLGLPAFQRELSAGVVYASRYSRRVADGEALFFLWSEAAGSRSLQPAAEAGLHDGDRAGSSLGVHWACGVEAGSVFLAGLDDGRISLRAHLALRGDVGDFVFCAGTSGDGDSAWVGQFRFHGYGVEEGSGVLNLAQRLAGSDHWG